MGEVVVSQPVKVLFVCLHGAAKSVVAAEYLRRPAHVVRSLATDGFDVTGRTPQRLTDAALVNADVVISLGCSLETGSPSPRVISWNDIPAVSDGYEPARDAIIQRLRTFLAELGTVNAAAGRG